MFIFREDTKLVETKNFFVCGQVADDSYPLIYWLDGKKKYNILKQFLPLTFFTDVSTEPGDYARASDSTIFLGNDNLKDVFNNQIKNEEIEILPCKIINKKLNKEYNYWLFNVVNVKKIIDVKHSKTSKYSNHLQPSFLQIKVNQKAISKDQDIYYDPNMLGEYIISDRLAEKLINAKLTGMEVIPIEEYTDKFYKE